MLRPVSNKSMSSTYRFLQAGSVWVLQRSVFQYLFEQQWVLDQARAWNVQEAPQIQLPAEGGLKAALQEVLYPPVLLLLVQQSLGCQLVAAVVLVGI